jgi:acyl carrier protein
MSEVFTTVRSVLVDLIGVGENEVTPEASLVEDLGADSLDLVNFIEELEKVYTKGDMVLQITEDDAEGVETIQQVVNMLERKGVGG